MEHEIETDAGAETREEKGQKLFSQEDVDALISQRLERFSSKVSRERADDKSKLEATAKEIQALSERLEAANDELAKAKEATAAYELQALRVAAVRAAGLPESLSSRVSGQTEEELRADAEALAKEIRGHYGSVFSPLVLGSVQNGGEDGGVADAMREVASTLFGGDN